MSGEPAFRLGVALLLRSSWRMVRSSGVRLAGFILVTQIVLVTVVGPVLGWLFREALRANGMTGLDLGALTPRSGFPLTVALIIVIVALAFWMLALQFTVLVAIVRGGRGLTLRALAREVGRVARSLARPSSLPLLGYLFVLLPLTGFGFTSLLVRGIAIPPFVTGELSKSLASAVVLVLALLVLAEINVRLSLTIPALVLTSATGSGAFRVSWRLTRKTKPRLALLTSVGIVVLVAVLAGVALFATSLVPTLLADLFAPAASAPVAAFSLGIAQTVGMLLGGYAIAFIAAVLVSHLRLRAAKLPDGIRLLPATRFAGRPGSVPAGSRRAPSSMRNKRQARRLPALAVAALATAVAVVLGSMGLETMRALSDAPQTLALAHRGFPPGGVENTIGGLEAAVEAGADLVEMDVMQSKDGRFVVMHDANLSRLAGVDRAVKDMTFAELTDTTVRDESGHSDRIPSLDEYVTRAAELSMPLLIEIKLGGADTDDRVDRLVAELDQLGVLERNLYHSLDPVSVSRLKTLRPDLTVGYTMAFAGAGVPDTPADLLVVEQWTGVEDLQRAAEHAGLGFFAWTVNDERSIRELLRRDVDGIVTDRPDIVVSARSAMHENTGLATVLLDALFRFVTIV